MHILFLHGLESGPHGSKYQALKAVFSSVVAPDCSGINDEAERLRVIRQTTDNIKGQFLVVGSSMGGLMALLLQQSCPERIAGMVLCAPALTRPAAANLDLTRLPPTYVIHGTRDEVIPLEVSRRFGDNLIVVADDHRLGKSLPVILRTVFELKMNLVGLVS